MPPNLTPPSKLSDRSVRENFKTINSLLSIIEPISKQDLRTIEFRSNISIPYPWKPLQQAFHHPLKTILKRKLI